jgi:hypothetical protein
VASEGAFEAVTARLEYENAPFLTEGGSLEFPFLELDQEMSALYRKDSIPKVNNSNLNISKAHSSNPM